MEAALAPIAVIAQMKFVPWLDRTRGKNPFHNFLEVTAGRYSRPAGSGDGDRAPVDNRFPWGQRRLTMSIARINGIDLYYEETGSGPPLLLIAGLGGNTLGWVMLLPALAQHFRVIAFDNRGAGRSSAPPGPYTTRQMADDAAALLAHLGIERAHVLGLSLGGMIAQELALAHAERVDRLVLYATYARPRPAIHDRWLKNWVEASER